jgi:hypothetical protein
MNAPPGVGDVALFMINDEFKNAMFYLSAY